MSYNWGPKGQQHYLSQCGQDKFVVEVTRGKQHGTFVDIGAGHPVRLNNTNVLEKHHDWSGVSVDLGPPHTFGLDKATTKKDYKVMWETERNTPLEIRDALKINYKNLFTKHKLPKTIDYLSIDIDKFTVQPLLDLLARIPFDKYQFQIITFETLFCETYKGNIEDIQTPTRKFFFDHGYKLAWHNKIDDFYWHETQEEWYKATTEKD